MKNNEQKPVYCYDTKGKQLDLVTDPAEITFQESVDSIIGINEFAISVNESLNVLLDEVIVTKKTNEDTKYVPEMVKQFTYAHSSLNFHFQNINRLITSTSSKAGVLLSYINIVLGIKI